MKISAWGINSLWSPPCLISIELNILTGRKLRILKCITQSLITHRSFGETQIFLLGNRSSHASFLLLIFSFYTSYSSVFRYWYHVFARKDTTESSGFPNAAISYCAFKKAKRERNKHQSKSPALAWVFYNSSINDCFKIYQIFYKRLSWALLKNKFTSVFNINTYNTVLTNMAQNLSVIESHNWKHWYSHSVIAEHEKVLYTFTHLYIK